MRSQIATASKRNVRYLPYGFTEHGALMAASVLNTALRDLRKRLRNKGVRQTT